MKPLTELMSGPVGIFVIPGPQEMRTADAISSSESPIAFRAWLGK